MQASSELTDEFSIELSDGAEFSEVDEDSASEVDCSRAEVSDLTGKLTKLQSKYDKSLFRLENIKEHDESVHFHTGFPNYDTLLAFRC